MEKRTRIYHNEHRSLIVNIGYLPEGKMLEGHNIVLTGATGGIGSCIAKRCVEQSANVVLIGRNQEKLERICNELSGRAQLICTDLTYNYDYDGLMDKAAAFFGPVDCLVNNAGVSNHEGDYLNVTEEDWDEQFAINLKAPFFLTQAWLKQYRKYALQDGHIVMIASDTSGMGSTIPYGLTKVAIASFTQGLAKKLIREGIRVNALAPGTTLTSMTEDFTHNEVIRDSTLGGRVLFPEEIAQLCVLILSDLTTCVSGNVIGCTEANICFDNTNKEDETNP